MVPSGQTSQSTQTNNKREKNRLMNFSTLLTVKINKKLFKTEN